MNSPFASACPFLAPFSKYPCFVSLSISSTVSHLGSRNVFLILISGSSSYSYARAFPAGNARAYEYDDDTLIRMRNTFLEPKRDTIDDMLRETKHGYLLKGARNGQADANGEFMFAFQEAYLIEKGEIKELLKGASVSGGAF